MQKKDLINKLDYLSDCIKSTPINENDAINNITLCKDYLVRFYDLGNKHFNNINYEVKDIVDVLKRM